VEELNDSLTAIRGVSEVIRQRIDTLDQRLGVALSAAKQRESDMLHELKRKVDLDIAELERSVMSAADEIDPAKFLHSFMHRR
jgi:signal transduction histidine kinase